MADRWFKIPGQPEGERTLAEQMKGLDPALAAAKGKTVCDLGCAEGLIALEFARAGASSVYACDINGRLIETATALRDSAGLQGRVHFQVLDLADLVETEYAAGEEWRYDIVLALAIVHKLSNPTRAMEFIADCARERTVLRLPYGSTGIFRTKHYQERCDSSAVMKSRGWRMERQVEGPRRELVQHWVR